MSESVDRLSSIDPVGQTVRPGRDWLTIQTGKGEIWIDGRKTGLEAEFRIFAAADAQPDARAWAKARSGCARSVAHRRPRTRRRAACRKRTRGGEA
jgi:hypothetical protein